MKKAPLCGGVHAIPTKSSRPHHHPHALSDTIVSRIVARRLETKRCAEVIHQLLLNEGERVSLSSVKRILERKYLIKKRSPWKRLHRYDTRPKALFPGALVQIDTIHLMMNQKERLYVYTLLDVYSRFAFAHAVPRIGASVSVSFVRSALRHIPFSVTCLQSDHGPEFSTHFTQRIGIHHRHSRVRTPSDNGHLERFNRTLQEECLRALPINLRRINQVLPTYLAYYNYHRLHLSLHLKTPADFIRECCKAID